MGHVQKHAVRGDNAGPERGTARAGPPHDGRHVENEATRDDPVRLQDGPPRQLPALVQVPVAAGPHTHAVVLLRGHVRRRLHGDVPRVPHRREDRRGSVPHLRPLRHHLEHAPRRGLHCGGPADELCHVGYPGEMFTSSAPQDPLFWPLHGNAERFVQLIRILQEYGQVEFDETWGYEHSKNLASDTGIVCDWSQVTGMEMPTCKMETCPGHKENDILPFANLAEALLKYVSNIELYEAIHPYSSAMDYVYDSLDYWKGCTSHSLAYQALGTNILGT